MKEKILWIICTISLIVYSQEGIEEWDTLDASKPQSEESVVIPQTNTVTDTAPAYQQKISLQETIPPAPNRPIAQTIVGGVLTGSGTLTLILDFVLIGLYNAQYGEIPPRYKPQVAVYAIVGGVEAICGLGLLAGAQPKWKKYNEWEAKYQNAGTIDNSFQINVTFNF